VYVYTCDVPWKNHLSPLSKGLAKDAKIIYLPDSISLIASKVDSLLSRLRLRLGIEDLIRKAHLRVALYLVGSVDAINTHLFHSDRFIVEALSTSAIPIVLSDHGDYRYVIREGLSNQSEVCELLNRVDAIICPSKSNAQIITGYSMSLSSKTQIVYNGACFDRGPLHAESARLKLGISSEAFVFGMIARGIPQKGWSEALEAFEHLCRACDKEVHLIFVGESDYLLTLKKAVSPENLEFIHFAGNTTDPSYWIESFDVGLLPTYFSGESLPNTVSEYLLLSKPVITTDVGGISEMVSYGGEIAGWVLPLSHNGKADPCRIASAMQCYVENPLLVNNHSQIARKASEKFSMEKCVKAYENVFLSVI
jgi:glycosyltransferase involved in cell wall biosynthesis